MGNKRIPDKTNPEYMKEYLSHVITFEKHIYVWSYALNEADNQIGLLTGEKAGIEQQRLTTENTLANLDDNVDRTIRHRQAEIERCKKIVEKKKPKKIAIFSIIASLILLISIVTGVNSGFLYGLACAFALSVLVFNVYFFMIPHSSEQEIIYKYTKELESQTHQQQAKRQKVLLTEQCKKLDEAYYINSEHFAVTNENRSKVINALNNARGTLEQIYALDVLPKKYRSLNAAATLYEYLDTGRCTIVQGHGGIYDTYEYDLKLGVIIDKLEEIITILHRIEETQHLLYEEVCSANKTLNDMRGELKEFKNSFDDFAAASLQLQSQTLATANWMAWQLA